jgi:LPS O-antigen subunit length determinant protein (WzzB/FepE family)
MALMGSPQLWQIIWNGKKLILGISVLAVVLALLFESNRNESWKTTATLSFSQKEAQETSDFNYDHYYSLEATDTLTDSIEEWLKSPSFKNGLKKEVKVNFKSAVWRFWENNNLKVSKKAPQIIEITFFTNSESNSKIILGTIIADSNGFLSSLNQIGRPYFYLTNSSSALELQVPRYLLISCLSFLWGVFIGIIIVLEKENLKNVARSKQKRLL